MCALVCVCRILCLRWRRCLPVEVMVRSFRFVLGGLLQLRCTDTGKVGGGAGLVYICARPRARSASSICVPYRAWVTGFQHVCGVRNDNELNEMASRTLVSTKSNQPESPGARVCSFLVAAVMTSAGNEETRVEWLRLCLHGLWGSPRGMAHPNRGLSRTTCEVFVFYLLAPFKSW